MTAATTRRRPRVEQVTGQWPPAPAVCVGDRTHTGCGRTLNPDMPRHGHDGACAWKIERERRTDALRVRLARIDELAAIARAERNNAGLDPEEEQEMAKSNRETAEAMNLDDLRKRLVKMKVAGSSKMNKADAVDAFVKASKPKKATAPAKRTRATNDAGDGVNVRRLPHAIEWSTSDGSFTGQSRIGDWGAARWRIRKYLLDEGNSVEKVTAWLDEAGSSVINGDKIDVGPVVIKCTALESAAA